jgi:hypothetical protein
VMRLSVSGLAPVSTLFQQPAVQGAVKSIYTNQQKELSITY